MGVLTKFAKALEKRLWPDSQEAADEWQRLFQLSSNTNAGPHVTESNAITYSAVFAAVRVLADGVASLPLLTYRRQADGGRERAQEHEIYRLLHERPNPAMTPFAYKQTKMGHLLTWGNHYSEIEWNARMRPVALWPLNPARMEKVDWVGPELYYWYRLSNGQLKTIPGGSIHHVRGLSHNGIMGYSPIRLARQSIGLGLGTEEFGSRFFGNGARPGVLLKHPGVMSDEAYERLRKSYEADHAGLSNAHRVKILEEGLDVETIGVPPEEAQFLETRKFQITEIARWFRIPPHKIGDLERSTFSNIEHQNIDFVTDSLRPWLVNDEQSITRDLMTSDEREELFVEYLVDALLRGDTQSRFEAYATAIQNGWMSPNEVRARENMNPYDSGDTYLLPLNMTSAAGDEEPDPDAEPDSQQRAMEWRQRDDVETTRLARERLMKSYQRLYEDAAGRFIRREVADVRRAVDRHLRRRTNESFIEWVQDFYDDFSGVIPDYMRSIMLAQGEQLATVVANELGESDPGVTDDLRTFIGEYLERYAAGYSASSRNQLLSLMDDAGREGEDPADLIEERLDGWQETQPSKEAMGQSFNAGNALVLTLYAGMGVQEMRWAARGDACPFCKGLDGRVVGLSQPFIPAGGAAQGGPGDDPMLVRRDTRHGPLHRGCDCVVLAA